MTHGRLPYSRFLKLATIVAIVFGSTLGVGGQRHRAKVSSDLLSFESRRTTARTRVIVRGSRMEIEALASRKGLGIARWLGDSAVLLANSAQVSALAAERDVLSGDLPVGPFMDVSNVVDRVRSGSRRVTVDCCSASARYPASPVRASPSRSSTPASLRIRR